MFVFFGFFGFGFFGFSWIGFAGIWRLASFLSYTTVQFISLIELSIFSEFLLFVAAHAESFGLGCGGLFCVCFVLFFIFWLWWCVVLLALVFGFEYLGWGSLILGLKPEAP